MEDKYNNEIPKSKKENTPSDHFYSTTLGEAWDRPQFQADNSDPDGPTGGHGSGTYSSST